MVRKRLGMCVGMLMLGLPAAAQERPQVAPERLVTTSGQATVRLVPNRAWVTIGIEQRAKKSQDAQRQAATVMQAVQRSLKALGIPDDAIRTISFHVTPEWDYGAGRRNLRGYMVTNHVEVKVDAIEKVGDVLDDAIAAGANAIHGVRWDVQNREGAERDALKRAVEDAKQRAEVAVAAAGGRLGHVARINEQRFDQPRPMPMMQAGLARAAEVAVDTPISPGELEIRASVNVSFTIL